jgi:hypothetical protein
MIDRIESMRETHDKLKKLSTNVGAKKEILQRRRKILDAIVADTETESDTPNDERIKCLEGYYSYIISYKLEDLIEEGNWVEGVILSAAILDDVGKRKLKKQFKGKINSTKIENLRFEETIMMLLASGLITPKIYQKLMEIKKVRNDLTHDSHKAMLIFLQTGSRKSKECKECKSAIEKAKFCLETINPPITPRAPKNQKHTDKKDT